MSSDVWIPKRKELHYFTRSLDYPSSSFLLDASPIARLFGREPRNGRFRWELLKALGGNLRHPSATQLAWDARFFLGRYDDDWYLSLFPAGKIGGEITPAYALLDDADVAALVARLPYVKIIYMLRNPVLRAWSTIRYHETRGAKGLTSGEDETIKAYLSQAGLVARSQYAEVIRRWLRHLPSRQFLIGYYDEISTAPRDVLRQILDFLEVPEAEDVARRVRSERVNASADQELPAGIEAFLSRQYLPMLEELVELVDSRYVADWLTRARTAARA